MSAIESPVAEHGVDRNLGVEELDELTVPILQLVAGLLTSILNLVLGSLGGLLGGLAR